MFSADRIFSQRNRSTGLVEWFFNAREGIFGPYGSRETTQKALDEFVKKRVASGDDGGRSKKKQGQPQTLELSLESREYGPFAQEYDPLKRKKGVDV